MTNAEKNTQSLPRQISANGQILEQIRNAGVPEDRTLALDFFFYTRSRERAEALRKHLEESMQYRADVEERGTIFARKYGVIGQTPPMEVSLEILDSWVTRMSESGSQFDCEFDGWGAAL